MKSDYVLVDADTWIGLYVDGKLVYQDHSLSIERFAGMVMVSPIKTFTKEFVDWDWWDDEKTGYFPENLYDVKFAEDD